ncbi:MAG: amidohydrolase family protein [Chlamydiia bacterium]|nr:amidohydrolase family protein [Chlamydiia bacterium]
MIKLYSEEIIDAHMHLWDLSHGDYPWLTQKEHAFKKQLGSLEKIRKNFLIDDYQALIKPHHVTKCIHLEANGLAKQALQETKWLQKIADSHGFPHAIVPFADLRDPDIENVIKDHCQFPNVRGIRQVLFDSDLPSDPHWHRGFAALAKQNLTFDLCLFGHQLPQIAKIIKEHDDVLFVLDHLGWPEDLSDGGFNKWKEEMSLLSSYPNAHLKLSGIGLIFKTLDQENISRFLRAGVEIFGEDRCFFGSNVPPDTLFLTYNQLMESMKEALSVYDLKVQRKLFFQNAKDFYDI